MSVCVCGRVCRRVSGCVCLCIYLVLVVVYTSWVMLVLPCFHIHNIPLVLRSVRIPSGDLGFSPLGYTLREARHNLRLTDCLPFPLGCKSDLIDDEKCEASVCLYFLQYFYFSFEVKENRWPVKLTLLRKKKKKRVLLFRDMIYVSIESIIFLCIFSVIFPKVYKTKYPAYHIRRFNTIPIYKSDKTKVVLITRLKKKRMY